MSRIAIIPARGGSKRIPRKNIRSFLGKPIIIYSIEAALKSGLFDEVMVSTDDEEIASIAKKVGGNVPFVRSKTNSNDFSTLFDVVFEVVSKYRAEGKVFDELCCVLPTAPFVTSKILQDSARLLENDLVDSVISVQKYNYPVQRGLKYNSQDFLELMFPNLQTKRSQDLEDIYHDAGQFYWAKTNSFLQDNKVACGNKLPYVLDSMHAHDIDNLEDWNIAEFKYKYNLDKNHG
ncbi:pseudaminic acid cytidylyltransferase [Labilibaculum euxinus]